MTDFNGRVAAFRQKWVDSSFELRPEPHGIVPSHSYVTYLGTVTTVKVRIVYLLALTMAVESCGPRPRPAVAVYRPSSETPYAFPLISPGAKFASLPPAVQHTIRAETGGED